VQHGDLVGDLADKAHIVFDDHQGVLVGKLQKKLGRGISFGIGHAGDGLIKKQQFRFLHKQHADLQPLLLAVREQTSRTSKFGLEPDAFERRVDAVTLFAGKLRFEARPDRFIGLHRQFQIVVNAHGFEHGRLLELAADARLRDLRLSEFG